MPCSNFLRQTAQEEKLQKDDSNLSLTHSLSLTLTQKLWAVKFNDIGIF